MIRDTSMKQFNQGAREGNISRPMSAHALPRPGPETAVVAPLQQTRNNLITNKIDDDDFEIILSPKGSLLASTQDPYDKAERIRVANANLREEKLGPRAKPATVRFNEKIRMLDMDEEAVMAGVLENIAESVESDCEVISERCSKTVHSNAKILLVNVPTGFSEDIEDIVSDEGDISQENDFRSNADGGQGTEKTECSAVFDEQTEITDEEDDDDDSFDRVKSQEVEEDSREPDVEDVIEDLTENLYTACRVDDEVKDSEDVGNEVLSETEDNKWFRETIEGSLEVNKPISIVNARPKTAQTKHQSSIEQKDDLSGGQNDKKRPSTAPPKRNCRNNWANIKLPLYNGVRSEYGLSADQLEERKKRKDESTQAFKQQREQLIQEQKKRQKENELMFASWLVKKKKEAALKAARRRQNPGIFRLKTLPAPTRHLEKMGVLRKKVLARREHTCYSLEEFFRNAKPHEQRTYRIYLGLCVE